jgi:hypothetical protein
MKPFTPEEELLLHSVMVISGINPNENDHNPKEITDRYSAGVLRRIGDQYQIYSCETEENEKFKTTAIIMCLCYFYFSMEYTDPIVGPAGPVKIRWMGELDFKAMIENEKDIFGRTDTEE